MFKSKRESIIVLVWMVILLAFTLIKVTIPALTQDLDSGIVAEQVVTDDGSGVTEIQVDPVVAETPVVSDTTDQVSLNNENTDSSQDVTDENPDATEADVLLDLEEIMETCELCQNNIIHGHSN